MSSFPALVRTSSPDGEARFRLGDPLVDSYLEFVAGRTRPNTLRSLTIALFAGDAHPVTSLLAKVPCAPNQALRWDANAASRRCPHFPEIA